ncbi:MAG: hypothetical protein KJ574_04085, partial [Nanoarchaeota archaeon]|nr:hypothetical protein [Nanoarchaeota archaeon]
LPFKADKYSVVMLLDVLEHIPKKEDVIRSLKEAYRVASKGMIISIPQNDSNDWVMRYSIHMDPDHLRVLMLHHNSWIYKPKSFQSMLKQLGYRYERMPQNNSIYLIKKTN